MRLQLPLLFLTVLALTACNREAATTTTLHVWHFWSEPKQRAVLDSLVKVFEHKHPTIDVELTELSWNDGKSKLQLAFNAGTQPDIIHLGLDWFAEFDESGVFADLPDSLSTDGRASRWLVNVRAFVHQSHKIIHSIGLATSDPHNVIKRCLPYLWADTNVKLYSRVPIAQDLNDALVDALDDLRITTIPNARIDRSRQLDQALLNGKLDAVLTGPWIVDMARERGIPTLSVKPMRSILNADVLSVAKNSANESAAHSFISYIRDYPQARAFCMSISDAGFPVDLARVSTDSAFTSDSLTIGFLRTAQMSSPLPHSKRMLSIEPIIEDMLSRCFLAKSRQEIASLVEVARSKVQVLELR